MNKLKQKYLKNKSKVKVIHDFKKNQLFLNENASFIV